MLNKQIVMVKIGRVRKDNNDQTVNQSDEETI